MVTTPASGMLPRAEDQPLIAVWPETARALMLGRSTVYDLAKRQELPVEVLRIGGRYFVRTAELREYLGLTA